MILYIYIPGVRPNLQRHRLMEISTSSSSSMSMPLCSREERGAQPSEETGWTSYLDELMASEETEAIASGCSTCVDDGSSFPSYSCLVSDAASCAPPEIRTGNFKEPRFKKRKASSAYVDDDSLQDTASSPVSSPKVGDLIILNMDYKKEAGDGHISKLKRFVSANRLELRRKEMNEMGSATHDVEELKARGLCLVPLSTLEQFLG